MRGNPGLVLLLLAPALLTGCKAIPGWPTDAPPSSAAAGPNGSERSWVVVAPGSPSASPTIKPAPSPSASPTGFLPTQPAHVDPTPTPACTARNWRPGQINGLTAVPGPGTATVHWVDPGGDDARSYRVTALSQALVSGRQREVAAQTVTPGRPCARLSATFRGLDRGAPYTFSLDAVVPRVGGDGTRAATVARTLVVYTT